MNPSLTFTFLLAISILSWASPIDAAVRGKVFIDDSKTFKLYSADVIDLKKTDADNELMAILGYHDPEKNSYKVLKVILCTRQNALTTLIQNSKRIAFKLHKRVFENASDFIYDVEIKNAFYADKFPTSIPGPNHLDKYPKTPKKKKPKFPKNLPQNFSHATTSFFVLLDVNRTVKATVPFLKMEEPFKQLTLDYIENTTFEKGIFNGKPVPCFDLLTITYVRQGFRPLQ